MPGWQVLAFHDKQSVCQCSVQGLKLQPMVDTFVCSVKQALSRDCTPPFHTLLICRARLLARHGQALHVAPDAGSWLRFSAGSSGHVCTSIRGLVEARPAGMLGHGDLLL